MTSTAFKIDNTSPLIAYSIGQWGEGSLNGDPLATSYFGNLTFHLTTVAGASMTFKFNGTSIRVGGAKRLNHGAYAVSLDGAQTPNLSGFAEPGKFQTPLFEASNLAQGAHVITLTNTPTDRAAPFLDIDFIEWNTTISGNRTLFVDHSDPSFSFQPSNAWSTDVSSLPGFDANSGRVTSSNNASMAFTFEGDAVELIGSVGPDHGIFTASIDNGPLLPFNATKARYLPQQVLYFADSLGPGRHSLTVTQAAGNNKVLAIDQARIFESQGGTPSGIPVGAIVGIVVGAVVALALIVVGYLFWRRRYLKWNKLDRNQNGFDAPNVPASQPTQMFQNYGQTAPVGNYGQPMPFVYQQTNNVQRPPPHEREHSYAYSHGPASSSGHTDEEQPTWPSKQALVIFPPQPPMPVSNHHFPPQEFHAREKDHGPVPVAVSRHTSAALPPDYDQATEPYPPPNGTRAFQPQAF